jgi:PIN domain nuclease of toxin-antitoxin system
MTDKIVFDSSAILALLKMEQGHEMVAEQLENAIVSSVNFCEVITVVSRKGFGQEKVIKFLKETFLHIEDFDTEQAIIGASFNDVTKNGLSLGDRACLALAKSKSLPVLTADKIWKELGLNVEVQLIR